MNQTTAIVSGGVLIVGLALLFYWMSGDGLPQPAKTSSGAVAVEEKTLTLPPPLTTTGTEAIKNTMPETQQAGAVTASSAVVMKTSKGDITLRFASADAPNTVANFLKLAGSGFYNGVKFHRVIKGFMIQAGDPNSKDDSKQEIWGQGGPGYQFADEINAQSALYKKGYKRGVLAMANAGPNTNGSQFFIMHQDYPLPPAYTIFGEVVAGQDVVDAIANTPTFAGDRPVTPVVIQSIEVK
jgi:cyclophilin family peptidyl-prolyl cis-trans isomerase